jgi:hypothetical protein
MMTRLERQVQGFPDVHDVSLEGWYVLKRNEAKTNHQKTLDNSVSRYHPFEEKSSEWVQTPYRSYKISCVTPVIFYLCTFSSIKCYVTAMLCEISMSALNMDEDTLYKHGFYVLHNVPSCLQKYFLTFVGALEKKGGGGNLTLRKLNETEEKK